MLEDIYIDLTMKLLQYLLFGPELISSVNKDKKLLLQNLVFENLIFHK